MTETPEVPEEPKSDEAVCGVFMTSAHLMKLEIRKKDVLKDYVLSLIHKFTPQIAAMPKAMRHEVIQDALIAWMTINGHTRLNLKLVEKAPTVYNLLGRPVNREFVRLIAGFSRFRNTRYHNRHKGVMCDNVGIFEVIPEEEANEEG